MTDQRDFFTRRNADIKVFVDRLFLAFIRKGHLIKDNLTFTWYEVFCIFGILYGNVGLPVPDNIFHLGNGSLQVSHLLPDMSQICRQYNEACEHEHHVARIGTALLPQQDCTTDHDAHHQDGDVTADQIRTVGHLPCIYGSPAPVIDDTAKTQLLGLFTAKTFDRRAARDRISQCRTDFGIFGSRAAEARGVDFHNSEDRTCHIDHNNACGDQTHDRPFNGHDDDGR